MHAELLELLLADHAGAVHRHEEQREAVVAGVGVGLRDEHDHVGAVAVGDVGLRAVDDVVVAVLDRARLDAGDVGAGVGLGDAEAEDLLALDRGHDPFLLLLLGAEREDRRHRHVGVHRDAHRQAARVRVADLLGEHQARVVVAALAAVLLGLVEAEEAELAHAREDRVGEGRLLPFLGVRRQLFDREVADRLAQLFVLVGEDEVLALRLEVGLEDADVGGGGHDGRGLLGLDRTGRRTLAQRVAKVNSRASYFGLCAEHAGREWRSVRLCELARLSDTERPVRGRDSRRSRLACRRAAAHGARHPRCRPNAAAVARRRPRRLTLSSERFTGDRSRCVPSKLPKALGGLRSLTVRPQRRSQPRQRRMTGIATVYGPRPQALTLRVDRRVRVYVDEPVARAA